MKPNSRLTNIATRLQKIEKRRKPGSGVFDKNIVKNKESEMLEEARWLGLSLKEINELSELQTNERKQYNISDIIKELADAMPYSAKSDINIDKMRIRMLLSMQVLLAYSIWSKLSLTEYDNLLNEILEQETKMMKSLADLTGLIMSADRHGYKQTAEELTLISSETAKLVGQYSENISKNK